MTAPSLVRSSDKAQHDGLCSILDSTFELVERAVASHEAQIRAQEIGTVRFVGSGIARVEGLPNVRSEELVRFAGGQRGMALNLDPGEVGVILLDGSREIKSGDEVRRTGQVMSTPVGRSLLGRVIDAIGRPLDGRGPLQVATHWPVERPAAPIMDRAPVNVPLQTGLKVVDALVAIGRGQRELILGDRQTGKTAIALDTIINQRGQDVICVYCAVGQRSAAVASVIADLREHGALDYSVVVAAAGEEPPGLRYVVPYAATTIGEYFMDQGYDVLVVYDDLTQHALAYRELSLLLRRPPGREAFPGDIFYLHSRLLERSTRLRPERGGGSLTALPIIETEAQNMAAYIPTNLISITDGQIYLSPDLYQRGMLPAVDVGRSVSRVGGKAQLAAYRTVAGPLRLSYTQFEELEIFSRFGTRLDDDTQRTLERGRRVREVLKQDQYSPLSVAEQIAVLLGVTAGLFDDLSMEQIAEAEQQVRQAVTEQLPDLCRQIHAGEQLSSKDRKMLVETARRALA
jgi:F-type H+-transporting ATPase subunit alpha